MKGKWKNLHWTLATAREPSDLRLAGVWRRPSNFGRGHRNLDSHCTLESYI